mmetsp:Transcript_102656/g.260764  ORF Transcript_102656/g.260764 Transcript_102656/m.260764 type:complete len:251 (+) Transcript_102656:51-803(+)
MARHTSPHVRPDPSRHAIGGLPAQAHLTRRRLLSEGGHIAVGRPISREELERSGRLGPFGVMPSTMRAMSPALYRHVISEAPPHAGFGQEASPHRHVIAEVVPHPRSALPLSDEIVRVVQASHPFEPSFGGWAAAPFPAQWLARGGFCDCMPYLRPPTPLPTPSIRFGASRLDALAPTLAAPLLLAPEWWSPNVEVAVLRPSESHLASLAAWSANAVPAASSGGMAEHAVRTAPWPSTRFFSLEGPFSFR